MKNKRKFTESGFITPRGRFISIADYCHEDYCEEHGLSKDELLCDKGYIAISGCMPYFDAWEKITQSQLDTYYDYCKFFKQLEDFKTFLKEYQEARKED